MEERVRPLLAEVHHYSPLCRAQHVPCLPLAADFEQRLAGLCQQPRAESSNCLAVFEVETLSPLQTARPGLVSALEAMTQGIR